MNRMGLKFRQAFDLFFNPMTVGPFVFGTLGAVAISVLGNGVYTLLYQRLFGNRPDSLWLLIVGTIVFLVVCLWFVAWLGEPLGRALQRVLAGAPKIGDNALFKKIPRRGVIFTIGLKALDSDSIPRWVFHELKPELVGFLGTPETDKMNIPTRLAADFGLAPDQWKSESWVPAEATEGKIKSRLVIDWMRGKGLDRSDIVVDITGGLVPFSVVAFVSAEERQVDAQYILSEFDKARNQVLAGSQRGLLLAHYSGRDGAGERQSESRA